jgi:cysteinyl-tRNA synthetase
VPGSPLTLFNTLGRRIVPFEPLRPPHVGIYSCGPTVYAYPHIGNMRPYVVADVLCRVLRWKGYDVTQVVNITDVGHLTSDEDEGDDKVESAALRTGRTVWDIAQHYTDAFLADIDALGIVRPDVMPRATDHVKEMIEFAERLVDLGYAYPLESGLYFDTSRSPNYGELAGLDIEGLRAGARVELIEGKRNKTDFALWRTAEPDSHRAMEWDSPWGTGAPGWHLECSVMSIKYLGRHFDIHTGGIDHVPVHHVNEIAQSEAWLDDGQRWVPYWLHNEFLVMSKAKMAKSAGGTIRLDDVVALGIEPAAYRLFLLGAQYRAQLDYDVDEVAAAQRALDRYRDRAADGALPDPDDLPTTYEDAATRVGSDAGRTYLDRLDAAVSASLDTPGALALLGAVVRDQDLPSGDRATLIGAYDRLLGLDLAGGRRPAEALAPEEEAAVQALLDERAEARAARDWARADELRDELAARGIIVEDRADGTVWKRG